MNSQCIWLSDSSQSEKAACWVSPPGHHSGNSETAETVNRLRLPVWGWRGGRSGRQSTGGFRALNLFCMTPKWWVHDTKHLSQPVQPSSRSVDLDNLNIRQFLKNHLGGWGFPGRSPAWDKGTGTVAGMLGTTSAEATGKVPP